MPVHFIYLQWSDPSEWILTAAGNVRDLKGLASRAQECGLAPGNQCFSSYTSESLGSQRPPYLERDREGNIILVCNCHFLKKVLISSSYYIQFLLVFFFRIIYGLPKYVVHSIPLGRMHFAGKKNLHL